MPTWNQVNNEIINLNSQNSCDPVRLQYLRNLSQYTGRSVIAYYSGWLQKRDGSGASHQECAITDLDMNGFMSVVHNLDRSKGLDLILHTPGGGIEATRAIVEYLYQMFGKDIRVIVPHMAMSAGAMISCSAKEIYMAKHSCLGPTDPQVRGLPAMGVISEVEKALEEIKEDPLRQFVYQPVFAKYVPAFLTDCQRAIGHTRQMVQEWLKGNMFSGDDNPEFNASKAIEGLMDYEGTSGHDHHFLRNKCKEIGLKVLNIEDDQDFQEHVLSVHHAFTATFALTTCIKLIENSDGANWIVNA